MFVEYIDTFLKLRVEVSCYPSRVRTPADEDRYIEEFRQIEGILLDKDKIEYNASTRALAKPCLFSVGQIWGEPEENTDTVNFRALPPMSPPHRHQIPIPLLALPTLRFFRDNIPLF